MYKIKIEKTNPKTDPNYHYKKTLGVALLIYFGAPLVTFLMSTLAGGQLLDGLAGGTQTNTSVQNLFVNLFAFTFLLAPFVSFIYVIVQYVLQTKAKTVSSKKYLPLIVIGAPFAIHLVIIYKMFSGI